MYRVAIARGRQSHNYQTDAECVMHPINTTLCEALFAFNRNFVFVENNELSGVRASSNISI